MGQNLGPLNIQDTYEDLVQISGSQLTDGTGSLIELINISASHANFSDTSTSSSFSDFATSASFALFASGAVDVNAIYTASITDATIEFEKGDATTFEIIVDNVENATSASRATSAASADTATSASHAVQADNATTADSATTASYVETAQTASYILGSNVDGPVTDAVNAVTAVTANTASYVAGGNVDGDVATATSASHAVTADTASFLPADTNLNINTISASFGVFQSASIGYLQTITGSAKIIGDAYIILNNDTPTERYAGIIVQDSGSTQNTASFEFDGQTNDWFYEYTDDGGATAEFGVTLFGPGYNTRGAHVYPSNNTILKGTGDHHVVDSSITDDGTLVTIDANVSASGYISASAFSGDGSGLTGIAAGGIQLGDTATSLESVLTTTPASAQGAGDVAIGNGAVARGGDSISIGDSANDSNNDAQAIAIGADSEAGFSSMTIGFNAESSNFGIALGHYSYNQGGVTIGRSAQGNNSDIVAVGGDARSDGNASIALGAQARSDNDNGVAIGKLARATGSLNFVVRVNNADLITATTASQDITFHGQINGTNDILRISNDCGVSGSFTAGSDLNTATGDSAVALGLDVDADGDRGFVGGGYQNNASGTDSVVLGGFGQTASALRSGVFAGSGGTASHSYSVVLGGSGLSTTKQEEAVVKHLTTKGQVTGDISVITPASSTGSMDCSTGNFFAITLGSGTDTLLEASNITAGQTINLKVNNNGVSAGTLSFDSAFQFVDGTAFEVTATTSAVDIMTFISFDGTSLQATGLKNFS